MYSSIQTSSINNKLEDPALLVDIAEENYAAYIQAAAEDIMKNPNSPIVLLSGPSGSGKTTTALRIADYIKTHGADAHVLSMDNYFLPVDSFTEKTLPRDENGEIDLESPLRLDIKLFSEHLQMLAEGKSVMMPIFDFPTQSRPAYTPLHREKNEFMIIEGIHALNPLVTGDADKFCTCMYVSVRTRIRSEDGDVLHPRQIRLMRRLCRDKLFRKRNMSEVFEMFESVSNGEDKYIIPFKSRADIEIDTFMAHEPPIYKAIIYKELLENVVQLEKYPNYSQIVSFLDEIEPISLEYIPRTSLIREFVGGSTFDY